jgi:hypothetical protein
MMSFTKSLIVGVHDGYELLQFSLPSLNIVPVDEVLMVLDRVKNVDKYRRIIHNYVPKAKILEKNFAVRKNRPNETFQYGFDHAHGDLLYVSAEDIILDPAEFSDSYWQNPAVGMVDFRYFQRDPFKFNFHVAWDGFLLKFSDVFHYGTVRSGLYGVRRELLEKIGGLKDSPTEEDWLRKDVMAAGYRCVHVKTTRNFHLRPVFDKQRQIMQGRSRKEQGFSFARVVLHSVLHLKPYVLEGYVKARSGS